MNRKALLIRVFVAAALIRLVFAWQWQNLPYAEPPYLDALSYDQWARSILDGDFFRKTAFYQSPLYPYVLAVVYKIFGPHYVLVSILQGLLDSLTCVLLSDLALFLFGLPAALATGLLAVLYRPLIFYSAPLMKESLGLFLLALFVWTLFRAQRWAIAGIALGLAALCRTNVLVLWPIALLYAWRKKRARACLQVAACTGLMVAAATLHNRIVSGDWIAINSAGGFNFYIGHHAQATGANTYPDEISTDPRQEEHDTLRVAAEELRHWPSPAEASTFWYAKALQQMRTNPENEWHLLKEKILLYFNDYETPDNYDAHFIRHAFPTILSTPLFTFAAIVSLAVMGMILNGGFWLAGCASLYTLSVLAFYVTDRYRLPVVIFLFPLAGAAFANWSRIRPTRRIWAGLLGGFTLILSLWPITDPDALSAYNWGVVASLYANQKRDTESVAAIERALKYPHLNITADALIRSAEAYERLGQLDNAESLLRKATAIHPKDGLTFHNLGRFYFEHERFSEARDQFTHSVQIAPWNYQPYVGLALTALKDKKPGEAAWAIEHGERMAPDQAIWEKLRAQIGETNH